MVSLGQPVGLLIALLMISVENSVLKLHVNIAMSWLPVVSMESQ